MSRTRLIEMARRSIDAGRVPGSERAEAITRLPAANYTDPDRFAREVSQVFRRLPLLLATSAELRAPNSYKAIEVAGVPVLLTRAADGAVRAFVNMCSHRGAMLVDEGSGTARRFACPYHAWTYDQTGDLVGMFKQEDFGEADHSCLGLTALPVAERAGLIWVVLQPRAAVDIDTFLCGYDDLLAHHRFAEMHHYGSVQLAGPNWKVAFDGYVDFYHLPILHRNTFGPTISPDAVFHAVGPHQRITGPRQGWSRLADLPEDEWRTEDLIGGVWSVFPHGSIASFQVGADVEGNPQRVYQIARLFPGATVGESLTHLDFVSLTPPDDGFDEAVRTQIDFLIGVVRDEDYATGLRLQRNLQTGLKPELLFGRNEGGAQHVHRWIDAVLGASDDELAGLFRDAR